MNNLCTLLQHTAQRYEAAVTSVLELWSPPCGCIRPGTDIGCKSCPGLAVFQQLVAQKIIETASPTKEKALMETSRL